MASKLKVTLVCIGKFHHFDLARQLFRKDMLERIFTGYPRWKLRNEQLPHQVITTFPWLQTPYMALGGWGVMRGQFERDLAWWAHETLDHFAAATLPQSDILFALSGSGLKCGMESQRRGAKYVCDRGSSHIRYQDTILREEYARWDENFLGIDPRRYANEEREYEVADIITVPSSFSYRTFVQMGVSETKLRKVPYGVDMSRFKKVADPDPRSFDVLFVGQVSFRKGIPYLLEAFSRLVHPKKKLRLIGTIHPEVKRYLKRHLPADDVQFLGRIPQVGLKQVMSCSHVMVLPSVEDGLALVQAQALACGCPVIGTTNTGADDLFTDEMEGFIVPIRDARIIAEKLQELADDPDKRQAMSEAALKRVASLGGWDAYGNQMVRVLEDLCTGNEIEKNGLSNKKGSLDS